MSNRTVCLGAIHFNVILPGLSLNKCSAITQAVTPSSRTFFRRHAICCDNRAGLHRVFMVSLQWMAPEHADVQFDILTACFGTAVSNTYVWTEPKVTCTMATPKRNFPGIRKTLNVCIFPPQNVSLLNAILLRLGEGQLPGAFANKRQKLLNSRLGAVVYMKPKTPFTLGLPVRFSGGLSAL